MPKSLPGLTKTDLPLHDPPPAPTWFAASASETENPATLPASSEPDFVTATYPSLGAVIDTPVMRQYLEIKQRYSDCVLLFRMGDFYEMFFDDAIEVSQLLDLTLTARDKHRETPVPMCGVPYHAVRGYIGRLIGHGKKVAICDQIEDAKKAKKIVRRAVTQVVTPGVILDEDQLEPKAANFLCAICPAPPGSDAQCTPRVGLAYLDVSTGEFAGCELTERETLDELCRIAPAELLLVEDGRETNFSAAKTWLPKIAARLKVPTGQAVRPDPAEDRKTLGSLGSAQTAADAQAPEQTFGDSPYLLAAAAACLRYARATQPLGGLPIVAFRLYKPTDCLVLDETTKTNLELLQTLIDKQRKGSLLGVLDQVKTAMGGRLLRQWLLAPLLDRAAILARHDAVGWLVERQASRQTLRDLLRGIHDLERLTGRLTTLLATPRDLAILGASLSRLPQLVQMLSDAQSEQPGLLPVPVPPLLQLPDDLCQDVAQTIGAALIANPPLIFREGGFIRPGYSTELDEYIELAQGGKKYIHDMQEREQARTFIPTLKIRYNKVFGYYIEVAHGHVKKVPPEYVRKQTTVAGERYVTIELAQYEARVLTAEQHRIELELTLFDALRKELAVHAARLLSLAQRVAQIDVLLCLAEVAHLGGYCRPVMTQDLRLEINDGRHPVIEQLRERGTFVPNDTVLDPDGDQMLLLTGPNMAGKSTVMRQVALICILAQMGSFVPARRAELGLVDRVLTRVGASDNLARGDSTFMVEMRETGDILHKATRRSLVVLDEIGRGTSTFDGMSIAWAVAEHLVDVIGCKTLFATHYHELTALSAARPRVRNYQVAIRQHRKEIVFLHKLVPGGANRSYGVEVARLAGLPAPLLARAREILWALEQQALQQGTSSMPAHGVPPLHTAQLSLLLGHPGQPVPQAEPPKLPPGHAQALAWLAELDPEELSPRAAHEWLTKLVAQVTAQVPGQGQPV